MPLLNSTYSLAILENELTNIVATQGSNAMEFAELVRENEEILDAMKVSLFHMSLVSHISSKDSLLIFLRNCSGVNAEIM